MASANVTYTIGGGIQKFRIPDFGVEPSKLLDLRDNWFNYYAAYRNRHMQRMALALNYYIGRQWIELDSAVVPDGVRGYAFKPIRRSVYTQIPKPVTNRIGISVDSELAALSKRELVPNVIATSTDPKTMAGAKESKRVLNYSLDQQNWEAVRDEFIFLTIATGTGCLKSWWDESYRELTRIATPGAVRCPSCQRAYASTSMPQQMLAGSGFHSETWQPNQDNPDEIQAQFCPECEQRSPLQPTQLRPEELALKDPYQRPLGDLLPKGRPKLEVVSPFELFPENGGIDVTPRSCRIWGQSTVRSMDWIEEHYPHLIDKIQPEDPAILMRLHPMLVEWNLLGRYHTALDSGIYDNHARVFEIHCDENLRFPDGRSIVMIQDQIDDGPLYKTVDAPDPSLPQVRVKMTEYCAAIFKARHREFWGQSLVDDQVSPQNRINAIDSQTTDARERMGTPNLLVTEAMELGGPEYFEEYGGGKIMHYTKDPLDPQAKPEVFGGVTMPVGAIQERDRCVADMTQIAGPQSYEIGEAPKNITTTSGLQMLGEAAERKRAPRERPLEQAFERAWSHQLELLWALRVDEDDYEYEDDDGAWQKKQFNRTLLCGQTKVKVEKQAYVDKSLIIREGVREAMADGLYRTDSQYAIKKILEMRGLPTDVNEDLNRQVELAERQWVDFVDDGVMPGIDPALDDPVIHFNVLGIRLMSDKGQNLQKKLQWPTMLKMIGGWEDGLAKVQQLNQQVLEFYGGYQPQQQANEFYAKAMQNWAEQMKAYQGMQQTAAMGQDVQGQMAMTPPPQEPPKPVFLPPAIEDQIMLVWKQLLNGRMQDLQFQRYTERISQVDKVLLDSFMEFMAVVHGYKVLAEQKQQAAMMGVPQQAAPGQQPEPAAAPGQGGANAAGTGA